MMGEPLGRQDRLFYEFDQEDMVPAGHLLRRIDAALDLGWLRGEMTPHYSRLGRPSVCPELMIRMLIVGYRYSIRSERRLCQEVMLNLAYRWFCGLGLGSFSMCSCNWATRPSTRPPDRLITDAYSERSVSAMLRPSATISRTRNWPFLCSTSQPTR